MDQELKLTPKQKEEAKDCLFKLLKENGTYDELYQFVRSKVDAAMMAAHPHSKKESRNLVLSAFCKKRCSPVITGFIIDYLRTLGLNRTLAAFKSEASEATFFERSVLMDILSIRGQDNEPLLSIIYSMSAEAPAPNDDLQMKSTNRLHTSFDDQYDQHNSVDLFNKLK